MRPCDLCGANSGRLGGNPQITAEQFAALDSDGNGTLSVEEIQAAQAAGLIVSGNADAGTGAGAGAMAE